MVIKTPSLTLDFGYKTLIWDLGLRIGLDKSDRTFCLKSFNLFFKLSKFPLKEGLQKTLGDNLIMGKYFKDEIDYFSISRTYCNCKCS